MSPEIARSVASFDEFPINILADVRVLNAEYVEIPAVRKAFHHDATTAVEFVLIGTSENGYRLWTVSGHLPENYVCDAPSDPKDIEKIVNELADDKEVKFLNDHVKKNPNAKAQEMQRQQELKASIEAELKRRQDELENQRKAQKEELDRQKLIEEEENKQKAAAQKAFEEFKARAAKDLEEQEKPKSILRSIASAVKKSKK